MSYQEVLLNEFNVLPSTATGAINTDYLQYGFVLDFVPTPDQVSILKANARRMEVRTMFTAEERANGNVWALIAKQVLHYFEVYGLGRPGIFNMTTSDGSVMTFRNITGQSDEVIQEMINFVIYGNHPVRDYKKFIEVLNVYDKYEFSQIQNNELRVALFDPLVDVFTSGDDVVRWVVNNTTDSNLLIKSPQVIAELANKAETVPVELLERHIVPLSEVFNRHKSIILSLKTSNPRNRRAINAISRLSKKNHVPVREAISKTFVTKALRGEVDYAVLDKIGVRDKFKYLNLLAWKMTQTDMDAFVIRNGKVHIEKNREVFDRGRIVEVETKVLESLGRDLAHLNGKNILLDPNVDIGLPISRKQVLGNLPIGTAITVDGEISAGIHWKESYNVSDLDLSAVDKEGNRFGWGSYRGYNAQNIVYSGDVTWGGDGAMEFMTSKNESYGVFVNVFRGGDEAKADIVVGHKKNNDRWIDKLVVQEQIDLPSKGMIIGFVQNNKFVVYSGRLNNNAVSANHPIVGRGFADFWTIRKLFDALNISYDISNKDVDYEIDLTYDGFTFDKAEKITA